MTAPKPPECLAKAGSALWRQVVSKYDLRPDERGVLEDACSERDLIAQMSEALVGAPLIVKGSQGQEVINPLISELRQHRSTYATLMRQLKLPDEGGSSDAGGDLSAKNRAAAQARWARRGA